MTGHDREGEVLHLILFAFHACSFMCSRTELGEEGELGRVGEVEMVRVGEWESFHHLIYSSFISCCALLLGQGIALEGKSGGASAIMGTTVSERRWCVQGAIAYERLLVATAVGARE